MALEREARTEYMGPEIDKRNRNWQKIDTFFAEVPEDRKSTRLNSSH